MSKSFLATAVLAILILIAVGLTIFIDKSGRHFIKTSPSPIASANPSVGAFIPGDPCSPDDLKATMTFNSGAGTTHGEFIIQNIGKVRCGIPANKFIAVDFDKSVTNIKVKNTVVATADFFDLDAGTKIRGEVSFPLGAECSGPVLKTQATFTYPVDTSKFVTFEDIKSKSTQVSLSYCSNPSEITNIEVKGMGGTPNQ